LPSPEGARYHRGVELGEITRNARELLASLPPQVTLVAAGKSRSPEQLRAAVEGGITAIGHNYVQEAELSVAALGSAARWHFIGHLQGNKAKKAAALFDCVETVDTLRLGQALERACAERGKILPVLIEINIDAEENKAGARPEEAEALIRALAALPHLRVEGLMTMGKWTDDPEDNRPAFRRTRALFEALSKLAIPGADLRHLSMGMSDSYRVAIEEGATRVRIGTRLFGPR